MFQEMADFSIAYLLKNGVDYAEARAESGEFSSFTLRDGIPEVSSFGDSSGIGIRFSIKHNVGFIAINDFDKNKVKKLLDKSLKLTVRSHKLAEKIKFSKSKAMNGNTKVAQKIDIRDVDPSYKFKLINDLNKNLKSDHKYFSLSDEYVKKYYVNTEGSKIYSELPRVNFFYFLTLKEDGEIIQRNLQHGGVGGYELFKKWELEKEIDAELKALRENIKFGVKTPTDNLDVVLAPEVVGIAVHESGGHPYEADRIFGREAAQAGESFIKKSMIGHKIASSKVNIVDDPTIEGSFGFYGYDDEGVKARRKFMVKDGLITEFMHNRETAFKMDLESNGSARANGFSVEPIIRMSNTLLLPGKISEEEMIGGVKKGVYIKNFMEWNIDDVRYHQKYVGNEAYLIENGEITKPVKSPALEITTPLLWSSVDEIANNFKTFAGTCGKGEPMQGIPVWMGGPSIRLKNIKLS